MRQYKKRNFEIMVKKLILAFVCFLFVHTASFAQEPFPFYNEVQKFKKQDSIAFPASNQILFIGSSSFTFWRDVNDYFPGYKILNRAFGGSSLPDLMRYRYDVIFPYQPKQIIMYCGENDFAANNNLTPDSVLNRFKALFLQIRMKYPTVPFAYVSIKPSPSRTHLMQKFAETNKLINTFLKTQKQTAFINVYDAMLKKDGTPLTDIFLEDHLHMKPNGYKIWQKIIKPYLKK